MNAKFMEAWLQLMNDSMKGAPEAQSAWQSLMNNQSSDPAVMAKWMTQFMPAHTNTSPEGFQDWLEESWRQMGMVPRSRYLELLDRHEQLRQKLAEAEETIQQLQTMVSKDRQAEVKQVVDSWEKTMADTLKAQSDWMSFWTNPKTDDPPPSDEA